jgi:hypothetical protein
MSEEEIVDNNVGEQQEVPEETADTVVVPGDEKTISTGAYTKADLKVIPIVKEVADIPHVTEDEDKVVETTFTKEDAKFFAQMIWNIPPAVMGDYMQVDEKLVTQWGLQLFSYCERKGINMYDYMFDELGLVMSTGVIAASLAAKYKTHKKEEEEKKEEED